MTGLPGILTGMKRRDLAWIVDQTGELVAVAVIEIDLTSLRVDGLEDLTVSENETVRLPHGIRVPPTAVTA